MNRFLKTIVGRSTIGITLAPFGIYIDENHMLNKRIITHERIHWRQQMEMYIIFFYIWYFLEWLIKFFSKGTEAYYCISFEREAHINDNEECYYIYRENFAWFKYLCKSK